MHVRKFVTEAARAVPRRGLAGLIAVKLVIAGTTRGGQGLTVAAAVLFVGLGVGLAVSIVMARASIYSDAN